MVFLSIAFIIICPMWLATCPCAADSVVGKIKTMVGKTLLELWPPTQAQVSGLFTNVPW